MATNFPIQTMVRNYSHQAAAKGPSYALASSVPTYFCLAITQANVEHNLQMEVPKIGRIIPGSNKDVGMARKDCQLWQQMWLLYIKSNICSSYVDGRIEHIICHAHGGR